MSLSDSPIASQLPLICSIFTSARKDLKAAWTLPTAPSMPVQTLHSADAGEQQQQQQQMGWWWQVCLSGEAEW